MKNPFEISYWILPKSWPPSFIAVSLFYFFPLLSVNLSAGSIISSSLIWWCPQWCLVSPQSGPPCIDGRTGGMWLWGLSGPAEPVLAQMLRLVSKDGAGISVGSKNTSCYLRTADSCTWIFIHRVVCWINVDLFGPTWCHQAGQSVEMPKRVFKKGGLEI